ncbi:ARM repeat-containing protein [Jackrogersella minutella]|nr:ARM repeat-containing protein [Jackrogersella minutella]
MDFVVEVSGSATPFNLYELLRALQAAQSHDHSQREAATQQLQNWESKHEYYPALQTIFLNKDSPTEVRLLAIIQLKNGIDKHWRLYKTQSTIPELARDTIRKRLFQGTIYEGDRHLARLNSLVIAKVIRVDYPNAWPTCLTDLIQVLRDTKNGHQAELSGALVLLARIAKELGTARLRKSQTSLQSIAPEFVYVLCDIYGAKSADMIAFLTNGREDQNSDEALLAMENSLDAIKALRRLLLVGYEDPHKDNTVQQVWSSSQAQFGQFLGFINSDSSKIARCHELIGKHLMQFTKLHIGMAETHPGSFCVLPNSLELVKAYWDLTAKFSEVFDTSGGIRQDTSGQSKAKAEGPLIEKIALKGLLLLRACLDLVRCCERTVRFRSRELALEQENATKAFKAELFKDEVIIEIANVVITRLLHFRKADLDAWEEDPQEWEQQEETQGNAWLWEVRPCAEKLFLDFLRYYKDLLLPPLLSYFTTVENPETNIITREAVYTTMGLAGPSVHTQFDFERVLKTVIVADAQRTEPFCQVLRRRIAILLSQWVPIVANERTRPLIYEIFRHFLNPSDQHNDIVVRITTARLFRIITDEFGFEGEMFSPYASDVLTQLLDLLQDVEVDEAKLAILESTRSLISRMDTHVSRFGDMVMDAVPAIWQAPPGDLGFMMKQSVLAIIQTLVMSMKTESQRYQSMILPLIAEATQDGTDLYLYLIEEALDLWSNLLRQIQPPLSSDLRCLAETAIRLLTNQNEHTFTLISIVGCYIMLSPETMLEDQRRRPTLTALSRWIETKNREHVNIAIKYIESFIRLSHELGGANGLRIVVQDMMAIRVLPKIFENIHDSFEAHQTTGPKKRLPHVTSLTLVDYFDILSHIAVLDPVMFVEVLSSLGPLDQVWNWISAEWFLAFDSIGDNNRQKLNLLATTRLLEVDGPMQELVLSKLHDYIVMWTTILCQIIDTDAPNCGNDLLVLTGEPEPTEWDTPKDVRDRALFATDPVKRVQSLQFVTERLDHLVDKVGGAQAFKENWAVNVDKEVIADFDKVTALSRGET